VIERFHLAIRDFGIPLTFAAVFAWGTIADVSRYWTAVLLAGFTCYGTLRWTAARPPRLLQELPIEGTLARTNAYVLGRVSHQLNTFPSGHVSVSIAAAIAVAQVSTIAGAIAGIVAAMIAVAAVTGRYHYLVDVLLGAVVGVASSMLSLLLSR
jgi:membrane-associated phospholipid phosphatase